MRNRALFTGLIVAMALVGLVAACDKDRTPIVGPGPSPNPNPQPSVVAVEIDGPESIPPGQSAQFTATARLSDGTSQTPVSVRWYSSSGVLQVDMSGLATARQQTGEAVLSAEVTTTSTLAGVKRGSKEILVIPDGTYRIVGVVTDNGPPATPIVGARVEVSGTPIAAVTDWDGRYRLYGVPSMAEIRVTRDGYQPHVQRFQLTEHVTQNFQLSLSGARLDLAGPYTLQIDTGCEPVSTPGGPLDLRRLSYAAVVTQDGSVLEVVLTESSRFRINSAGRGNRFSGKVDSLGATFNLAGISFYDYSAYPDVVERMPDGTFLVVEGTVATKGSRTGLSSDQPHLSFNRFDSRWPAVPPYYGSWLDFCSANLPQRFTLTPR